MLMRGKQPSRAKVGFPGQFPGPPSPYILALGRAGRLEVAGRQEHPTSEGFGEELDSLTSPSASGSGPRTPKIPREAVVSGDPRRLRGAPPRLAGHAGRGSSRPRRRNRWSAGSDSKSQDASHPAARGGPWLPLATERLSGSREPSALGSWGRAGRDSRGAGTRAE